MGSVPNDAVIVGSCWLGDRSTLCFIDTESYRGGSWVSAGLGFICFYWASYLSSIQETVIGSQPHPREEIQSPWTSHAKARGYCRVAIKSSLEAEMGRAGPVQEITE